MYLAAQSAEQAYAHNVHRNGYIMLYRHHVLLYIHTRLAIRAAVLRLIRNTTALNVSLKLNDLFIYSCVHWEGPQGVLPWNATTAAIKQHLFTQLRQTPVRTRKDLHKTATYRKSSQ